MTWKNRMKTLLPGLTLLLLAISLLALLPVIAQETGPIVIISQVDDQNFPLVTARVTVIDRTGLAIDKLDPTSFLVWEDNQAARSVSVALVPSDQAEPISLVLVLDVSGSMDEPDENGVLKIDAARSAAKSLLNSLGPVDQAAVISFSEAITVEQAFTTDRVALQAAVDGLELDGDTALNNALFDAAELVAVLPPGKKAIILLTDGLNTHGNLTLEDALNRAGRSGVPVYTVGFFTSGIEAAKREQAEAALTRIARVTNGRYFSTPTAAELGTAFQTLSQLLRLQYELRFESNLVADCKVHELKVRVSDQGQDGDDFDVFNACLADPAVVNLDGPAEGETVSKLLSFSPHIAPPVEIESVEYRIDGVTQATFPTPPFDFEWDVTNVSPGSHTITIRVSDSAGATHTIERTITVVPPLSLQITAPANGAEISSQVEALAKVRGPGQIDRVEFYWDGELLDTATKPPFVFTIDPKQYLDGEYTLLVRAYEVDGYSVEDSVTVSIKAVTTNSTLWIALGIGIVILALIIPFGARARRRMRERASVSPANDAGYAAPVVSPPSTAWLEVVQGSMPGQRFTLSTGETTLGRSLAENDIHVEGRTASRRQAVIKVSDGQYVYYDFQPTNPTLINEQEIIGSHELREGDQIKIGDMLLEFTFEEK